MSSSSKVAISNRPSQRVLRGRRSGSRSTARSVFSSASVKSSQNQPLTSRPPSSLTVRRSANSGCRATSVVSLISVSWRSTATPSAVITRSGSTASAPSAIASRYDASVCSGR